MAAEQTPREDPTTEAIALVVATMQGETAGAVEASSIETTVPPPRGRLERPDRPRYSNSESTGRYSGNVSQRYRHEIWAPDKRPDGAEESGHLVVTAYLDRDGYIDPKGNGFDRYHYDTAADLVRLAQMGLGPLMEHLGIAVGITRSDLYYNRYCTIRVDFPSSQTFRERANQILAAHAAVTGRETLTFVDAGGSGRYASEFYLECQRRRGHPLAREYGTPKKEVSGIDDGTHDVLLHGLPVLLTSGTDLSDYLQEESHKTHRWVEQATETRYAKAILGSYMRRNDIGISLPTLMGALRGEEEGLKDFRAVAGTQYDIFLEQIRKNATTPHETGLWVPNSQD